MKRGNDIICFVINKKNSLSFSLSFFSLKFMVQDKPFGCKYFLFARRGNKNICANINDDEDPKSLQTPPIFNCLHIQLTSRMATATSKIQQIFSDDPRLKSSFPLGSTLGASASCCWSSEWWDGSIVTVKSSPARLVATELGITATVSSNSSWEQSLKAEIWQRDEFR